MCVGVCVCVSVSVSESIPMSVGMSVSMSLCEFASSLLLQGCSLLQCGAVCCSVLKRVVVSVSVSV